MQEDGSHNEPSFCCYLLYPKESSVFIIMKSNKNIILFSLVFLFSKGLIMAIDKLPRPTGHYEVGTVTYNLVDTSRNEKHVQDTIHPHRKLMLQLW